MKWYVYILATMLGLVSGCCKDECQDPSNPECANYDPCYGKQETSADFYTEIKRGNRWFDVEIGETDGELWRFRAKDSTADEYLWEVGADKFTTKSFTLSGFPLLQSIPIKLTVKRYKRNTTCYPNDKGEATLTKNIYTDYTLPYQFNYITGQVPASSTRKLIWGKYYGYNKRNPNFKFEFEFRYHAPNNNLRRIVTYFGSSIADDILEDFINIPYFGKGSYTSYTSKDTFLTVQYDNILPVDGNTYTDGITGGMQAGHFGIGTVEYDPFSKRKFYEFHDFSRYYSFFKTYIYLEPKNRDNITVEYWYRDTLSRKILKDTFIGTRVP